MQDWQLLIVPNTTLYHRELWGRIDYWFRLTPSRVEFTIPRIICGIFKAQSISELPDFESKLWNTISLNIQIYALDLEGDCNCPLFKTRRNYKQRFIFPTCSPNWHTTITRNFGQIKTQPANQWTYGLGLVWDWILASVIYWRWLRILYIHKFFFQFAVGSGVDDKSFSATVCITIWIPGLIMHRRRYKKGIWWKHSFWGKDFHDILKMK